MRVRAEMRTVSRKYLNFLSLMKTKMQKAAMPGAMTILTAAPKHNNMHTKEYRRFFERFDVRVRQAAVRKNAVSEYNLMMVK